MNMLIPRYNGLKAQIKQETTSTGEENRSHNDEPYKICTIVENHH